MEFDESYDSQPLPDKENSAPKDLNASIFPVSAVHFPSASITSLRQTHFRLVVLRNELTSLVPKEMLLPE
jgi:hypothetical protein